MLTRPESHIPGRPTPSRRSTILFLLAFENAQPTERARPRERARSVRPERRPECGIKEGKGL